jgi:hypothetical protein
MSSGSLDDCNETVVLVRVVLHSTRGTVSVLQTVRTLHVVSVSCLPMLLDVAGMRLIHGVTELVLWLFLVTRSGVNIEYNITETF